MKNLKRALLVAVMTAGVVGCTSTEPVDPSGNADPLPQTLQPKDPAEYPNIPGQLDNCGAVPTF